MGLKVLHLIDSGGLYGAERMLLALVAEQRKMGLEPMILSAGAPGIEDKPVEQKAREMGLPVQPWRMAPGLNLKETYRILQWAKANRYQVLHSHGYKFNILISLFPKRWHGALLMTTIHGYTAVERKSWLSVYQRLDRFLLRRADRIAVVSEPLRRGLSYLKTVELIPNGIDPTPVASGERANLPARCERFLIAIGRLSQEKGYDVLIDGFHRLADESRDIDLVIVGDGPCEKDLSRQAEQGPAADRIHFTGFLDNPAAVLKRATALVISSHTEGLPLVLLEAIKEGVPVISTEVGEIPTVLKGGELGTLVPSCDPNTLSEVIGKALATPDELQHKAALARSEFQKRYTAETMAESYNRLYQSGVAAS